MKLSIHILAVPCLFLASCTSLQEMVPGTSPLKQQGAFTIGQRVFDHASTNCIDEQPHAGFEYTVAREDGMFGYEFGLNRHSDRQTIITTGNTDVEGYELTAGLRREFPIEGTTILPYAGIGLEAFHVDRQNEFAGFREGSDYGGGAYARIGATINLDENTFIGIDVRFIEEEWMDNGGYNLDGDVVSFVLGYSF